MKGPFSQRVSAILGGYTCMIQTHCYDVQLSATLLYRNNVESTSNQLYQLGSSEQYEIPNRLLLGYTVKPV